MKLILASASEGRKKLLSLFKIPFKAIPSIINEEEIMGKTPLETLQLRAKKKGEDIAKRIDSTSYLILSADSGAIVGNELIGKPKNHDDAKRILQKLSGTTHEFITAIYAVTRDKAWETYEKTFVTFRKLSDNDIRHYLSITDYTQYAGGYALFASPQDFVIKTEGSLSNVIGLPLEKIVPILKENKLVQ
ncbi:septum formation protein Maf [Candidatus Gottesmanbacteria bacterium]|nr:septum formation protein Maf [Candidatus Gottesmanbacteria bacterium]